MLRKRQELQQRLARVQKEEENEPPVTQPPQQANVQTPNIATPQRTIQTTTSAQPATSDRVLDTFIIIILLAIFGLLIRKFMYE